MKCPKCGVSLRIPQSKGESDNATEDTDAASFLANLSAGTPADLDLGAQPEPTREGALDQVATTSPVVTSSVIDYRVTELAPCSWGM